MHVPQTIIVLQHACKEIVAKQSKAIFYMQYAFSVWKACAKCMDVMECTVPRTSSYLNMHAKCMVHVAKQCKAILCTRI